MSRIIQFPSAADPLQAISDFATQQQIERRRREEERAQEREEQKQRAIMAAAIVGTAGLAAVAAPAAGLAGTAGSVSSVGTGAGGVAGLAAGTTITAPTAGLFGAGGAVTGAGLLNAAQIGAGIGQLAGGGEYAAAAGDLIGGVRQDDAGVEDYNTFGYNISPQEKAALAREATKYGLSIPQLTKMSKQSGVPVPQILGEVSLQQADAEQWSKLTKDMGIPGWTKDEVSSVQQQFNLPTKTAALRFIADDAAKKEQDRAVELAYQKTSAEKEAALDTAAKSRAMEKSVDPREVSKYQQELREIDSDLESGIISQQQATMKKNQLRPPAPRWTPRKSPQTIEESLQVHPEFGVIGARQSDGSWKPWGKLNDGQSFSEVDYAKEWFKTYSNIQRNQFGVPPSSEEVTQVLNSGLQAAKGAFPGESVSGMSSQQVQPQVPQQQMPPSQAPPSTNQQFEELKSEVEQERQNNAADFMQKIMTVPVVEMWSDEEIESARPGAEVIIYQINEKIDAGMMISVEEQEIARAAYEVVMAANKAKGS